VQYLVAMKYALNAVVLTEFDPANCHQAECGGWANLLAVNDVSEDLNWLYWLILVSIFAGFRLVSLVILSWKAQHFET